MLRFIVKNKILRYLFIISNRSYTETVFLLDENDLLLFDESGNYLVE